MMFIDLNEFLYFDLLVHKDKAEESWMEMLKEKDKVSMLRDEMDKGRRCMKSREQICGTGHFTQMSRVQEQSNDIMVRSNAKGLFNACVIRNISFMELNNIVKSLNSPFSEENNSEYREKILQVIEYYTIDHSPHIGYPLFDAAKSSFLEREDRSDDSSDTEDGTRISMELVRYGCATTEEANDEEHQHQLHTSSLEEEVESGEDSEEAISRSDNTNANVKANVKAKGKAKPNAKVEQRGCNDRNSSSESEWGNTCARMMQLGFWLLPSAMHWHCEYSSGRQVGQRWGIVTASAKRLNARVYRPRCVPRKRFFFKFGPCLSTSDVFYSGAPITNIALVLNPRLRMDPSNAYEC